MPIKRSNGTFIKTIKAPSHSYYNYEWKDMTSSEIQTAVNSGKLSTSTVGEGAYSYTKYTSLNGNINVVQNDGQSLKIQEYRAVSTGNEIFTVKRSDGTLLYHKNKISCSRGWWTSMITTHQTVSITLDRACPVDIKVTGLYFQTATVVSQEANVTIKAGKLSNSWEWVVPGIQAGIVKISFTIPGYKMLLDDSNELTDSPSYDKSTKDNSWNFII